MDRFAPDRKPCSEEYPVPESADEPEAILESEPEILAYLNFAADTWGISIAPHCFHELMVHINCSIPNASYAEYMVWNDDVWVEPPIPVEGMLRPLEHPGHGLRFKPELLTDYRVGGFEVAA